MDSGRKDLRRYGGREAVPGRTSWIPLAFANAFACVFDTITTEDAAIERRGETLTESVMVTKFIAPVMREDYSQSAARLSFLPLPRCDPWLDWSPLLQFYFSPLPVISLSRAFKTVPVPRILNLQAVLSFVAFR